MRIQYQFFVLVPPSILVRQIVRYPKGISGNTLLRGFPKIRKFLWKGSYFCETIGSISEENILKFI